MRKTSTQKLSKSNLPSKKVIETILAYSKMTDVLINKKGKSLLVYLN